MIQQRGLRLTATVQQRQAALVRQARPDLAGQILTEPGWPALTATQTAGHDPATLLTEAARHRELDTADSVSDVLIWRLHRLAGLTGERPARQNSESSTRPGSAASVSHPSQAKTRRRIR
ncbi:hypothetical protein [Streptomyces sp. NRRL S-448]|uniref:hypothetical protein n=1 Tax=Streptomyces sp. NRRL S-448 TaxID=1463907 RepID=UPI003566219B